MLTSYHIIYIIFLLLHSIMPDVCPCSGAGNCFVILVSVVDLFHQFGYHSRSNSFRPWSALCIPVSIGLDVQHPVLGCYARHIILSLHYELFLFCLGSWILRFDFCYQMTDFNQEHVKEKPVSWATEIET